MKCQSLLSGKNKKTSIVNLSSAELAQGVVKFKSLYFILVLIYEYSRDV